jgi:hypothetical protein
MHFPDWRKIAGLPILFFTFFWRAKKSLGVLSGRFPYDVTGFWPKRIFQLRVPPQDRKQSG